MNAPGLLKLEIHFHGTSVFTYRNTKTIMFQLIQIFRQVLVYVRNFPVIGSNLPKPLFFLCDSVTMPLILVPSQLH